MFNQEKKYMLNKITSFLIFVFASLYLSSCNENEASYEKAAKLKQSHLRAVANVLNTQRACKKGGYKDKDDKLICQRKVYNNRKFPGGNSMNGKWMFVVSNEDNYVPRGITFRKTKYDSIRQIILWDELDRKRDLPADYVQYIGLLSLDSEGGLSGYETITNAMNRRQSLTDLKLNDDGELSWVSSFPGQERTKIENRIDKNNIGPSQSVGTKHKCKAKYKKETDTLYGMCVYSLLVNKPDSEERFELPSGNFTWRSIRISDADFARLSQPNVYNDILPQRLWFINRNHPQIKEQLGNDWY